MNITSIAITILRKFSGRILSIGGCQLKRKKHWEEEDLFGRKTRVILTLSKKWRPKIVITDWVVIYNNLNRLISLK